jgi:hypothetical protein
MMQIDLADYQHHARDAVRAFWQSRSRARDRQHSSGTQDQGERGAVTGGKNMDALMDLMVDLVLRNGLPEATIQRERAFLTLPGFFRPTKIWDLVVIHEGRLIAALEFKSQVGPSFGNNFNNRTEEALGTATDFWTAHREGAFGDVPRPFLGWLMLLEDTTRSRTPVRDRSPHFHVFPEFVDASYAKRYHLLCSRLTREALYTSTALLLAPPEAIETGHFSSLSSETGLDRFVTQFASHIALTVREWRH